MYLLLRLNLDLDGDDGGRLLLSEEEELFIKIFDDELFIKMLEDVETVQWPLSTDIESETFWKS